MRLVRRAWPQMSHAATRRVRVLSDIHLGVRACDEQALARAVREIRDDPDCYWIGLGDVADCVNKADKKRFSARSLADWITVADIDDIVGAQVRRVNEVLNPIAGKCLGFLMGNHEEAIAKFYERDAYGAIVRGLVAAGAPDDIGLGYAGWIQVVADDGYGQQHVTTIYAHHGYGGGALLGGKALRLARLMADNPDADIVLMGHVHSVLHTVQTVNRISRGRLVQRNRHGVICGTFLKPSVDDHGPTYGEIAMYPPSPVAWPDLVLRPMADNYASRARVVFHYT